MPVLVIAVGDGEGKARAAVVHGARIQRERLEGAPYPSLREYNMLYGLTKDREPLMKPDALV